MTSRPDAALDDTVVAVPRAPERPVGVDLDDTRPRGAAVPAAPDAAPAEPADPPAASAATGSGIEAAAAPATDAAGADAAEDAAPAAPALVVELPDGRRLDLDRPVYLGRRPRAPRVEDPDAVLLVELPSPGRELSSTHLELRVVGGVVVASDLRSTNGSTVAVPGSAPRRLHGGDAAVLPADAVVDLGEGNVLRIRSRA